MDLKQKQSKLKEKKLDVVFRKKLFVGSTTCKIININFRYYCWSI